MSHPAPAPTHQFDARGIAKRFRHAAIFGALESLHEGEVMRFINDHEPLPLLDQIAQRYRDQVRLSYVERSPERVVIDFAIHPDADAHEHPAAPVGQASAGGCGSGGGGCGCSGH